MSDIDTIRAEIERERKLVDRQRRDILTLKQAGRSTADAELILVRQLARLEHFRQNCLPRRESVVALIIAPKDQSGRAPDEISRHFQPKRRFFRP
jgi:hypothetical protein